MRSISAAIILSSVLSAVSADSGRSQEFVSLPSGQIDFASAARMEALEAETRELRAMLEQTQAQMYTMQGSMVQPAASACYRKPGFFAFGEYLRLKPRRSGMDFGIADPNGDNNIQGPVESLELDSGNGVRASLGYITHSGWDVAFTYTYLNSETSRNVVEPPGGRIWLTRSNPASTNNHADTADASSGLNVDVFDIEAGHWYYPNSVTSLRFFGGLRGATIEDQIQVTYAGGTIVGNPRVQTHEMQMDGLGIRVGAEGHWSIFNCLTVFSKISGTVMFGDFTIDYTEVQGAPAGGDVAIHHQFYETVPVLEAAVGLSLSRGNFEFQTGYEATSWMNLDQRLNFTGAETINRGNLTPVSTDLGLDGLFARLVFYR